MKLTICFILVGFPFGETFSCKLLGSKLNKSDENITTVFIGFPTRYGLICHDIMKHVVKQSKLIQRAHGNNYKTRLVGMSHDPLATPEANMCKKFKANTVLYFFNAIRCSAYY